MSVKLVRQDYWTSKIKWLSTRDKTYKEELNKIQKEIKKDIINYNKDMWEDTCKKIDTSKNDSWKYVKQIMKNETQKNYPTLSNNNTKFTNDKDKENAFKEHLEDIFNADNTNYNNSWKQKIKNTINTKQNFSKLHPTFTKTSETLDQLYEEISTINYSSSRNRLPKILIGIIIQQRYSWTLIKRLIVYGINFYNIVSQPVWFVGFQIF